jgi:peptide/nickel transport system substrate-binding protein
MKRGWRSRFGRREKEMAAMREGPSRSRARLARGPAAVPALLACVVALVLAACGTTGTNSPASVHGKPIEGGTASYALADVPFSWMFPLENEANYEPEDGNVESDMWRPLYFAGGPDVTGVYEKFSLAYAPVYSNDNQTVTIKLKQGYKWSDGTPVTTKDIQFFFQLEAAGVALGKYAPYVTGTMPNDIKSVTYNSPYEFTIQLIHSYNPYWFTGNQLTWVYPLPQQAWDKTCATCADGNAAATTSGAKAVFNFLYAASSQLSSYATNPLWKTVDGPWVISSYNPTTYHCVFVRNKKYTGPDKPHLDSYQIYEFNSDTAELDALRAGLITYGYLPISDAASASEFESLGYVLKPWNNAYYNEDIEFGFTGPQKALVSQLYIRQALQHLVDEPLYISTTLHGYGVPDYGIAPASPSSIYTSPQLRSDPYPYSPSAAKSLLSSHGWTKNSSGVDVCTRPGTASNECGAGITKNESLTLLFMYSTGTPSFLAQVEAFDTAAKQVGVNLNLDGQTTTTMFSIAGTCPPGPCKWGLAGYSGFMWDFGQYVVYPNGDEQFGQGNYWAGGYSSPEAQRLITAAETQPGLSALYKAENYLSQQVASLWWPLPDQDVLLVKKNLQGWSNLDPYVDELPSLWYYVK